MNEIRISPRDAFAKVNAGEAFLLDVVTSAAWRSLRVVPAGALRIPPEQLAERLGEIPKAPAAIAFCT